MIFFRANSNSPIKQTRISNYSSQTNKRFLFMQNTNKQNDQAQQCMQKQNTHLQYTSFSTTFSSYRSISDSIKMSSSFFQFIFFFTQSAMSMFKFKFAEFLTALINTTVTHVNCFNVLNYLDRDLINYRTKQRIAVEVTYKKKKQNATA